MGHTKEKFPQDERLEVCVAEKVPVISFFWREPGALVHRAKEAGAIVLQTVASANMARRAAEDDTVFLEELLDVWLEQSAASRVA